MYHHGCVPSVPTITCKLQYLLWEHTFLSFSTSVTTNNICRWLHFLILPWKLRTQHSIADSKILASVYTLMIPIHHQKHSTVAAVNSPEKGSSFPTTTSNDAGGEGDWMPLEPVFVVQHAVSIGSRHDGFTSLGRGFNWLGKEEEECNHICRLSQLHSY